MTPVLTRRTRRILLALAAALVLAPLAPARAASLVQVTGFGTNPTNLTMHLYVPDNVAARPGLLLALHYCTGTGQAFFSGTEFRSLADRHGFIVIYPSATRSGQCWDVSSPQALRRDGGSDPVGLRSMVSYVQSRYSVDPNKIFVTGASSGGMMTNVMLGLYPDLFKAGAAYMGVPFGCFATTDGSSWNSQCSSGQRIMTAQQWGDLVRAAYPGYTGARPRMQTLHGTTDSTLNYANYGEQIKQWTNVLGVSQTATETGAAGSCTRSRYGGTGVQPPVEGISCSGVGHSLPLSGQAALSIAFFGLDQTTPTTSYTLTVTKSGAGSGTVTSSAGGINCGSTCSASIASGTAVTMTAAAASGSTFTGWSGACVGTGSCVVTMTAARSVTAAFDGPAPTGAVSINAGGSAAGTFVADAYSTGGNTYSTTNTIDTSQITGTVPPQAVFQSERYGEFTYTIPNRTGAQTVTLYFQESYWTAAGQRTFNVAINGTTVLTAFDIFAAAGGANRAIARTFNATPSASGQVVIQFTRNGPDQPKVCGITVAAGQVDPDPDPDPTTQTLTVTKAGTGSGTVAGGAINCGSTCTASVASGTAVTLTATPAAGSSFAGWTGACSGTASCVVSMTAARSVTATFNTTATETCPTVTGGSSGNFNTTGAACFTVATTINGWGCSNVQGRTVTVNGTAATCSQTPLPGGAPYTFRFTAGTYPWASFYWW